MPRFESAYDIIDSLMLREGDILRRKKGLYLELANEVYNDMNDSALKIAERIKMPVRERFKINKDTNSIDIPFDFLRLSSVNIEDRNGILYPVYRNDKIKDDIVELSAVSNCACEFNCGYKMCNTMKGYEAVISTKSDFFPNGDPISFECTDKKVIHGNFLYEQTQYPLREYLSGVWTDTVLHTEDRKLCAIEVDTNGCCCDTEENINNICNSCGIGINDTSKCCIGGDSNNPPNKNCDTWVYWCPSKLDWLSTQCGGFAFGIDFNNIYNLSELGNKLVFPANFGWDKVVVRYFRDIPLDDLQIPYMAKPAFMAGLQYFATTNHDKKQQLSLVYGKKYSALKFALLLDLNKYTMAEMQMMITPPTVVPSYLNKVFNQLWAGYTY